MKVRCTARVRAAAAITAAARFDPLPLAHSNRSQVTLFVRLKDLRLTGRALQRLVRIAGPDRVAHGWVPTALRRCIVPPGTSIRCSASLRMRARSALSKSGKTALRSRLTGTAVRLADRSGWRRAYHEGLRRDLRIAAKLYGTIEQNKVRLSLSLQCACQPS